SPCPTCPVASASTSRANVHGPWRSPLPVTTYDGMFAYSPVVRSESMGGASSPRPELGGGGGGADRLLLASVSAGTRAVVGGGAGGGGGGAASAALGGRCAHRRHLAGGRRRLEPADEGAQLGAGRLPVALEGSERLRERRRRREALRRIARERPLEHLVEAR